MTEQVYQFERKVQEPQTAQPQAAEKPEPQRRRRREEEAKPGAAARVRAQLGLSPGVALLAIAAVAVVLMMLMSHAQLIMVNDQLVSARNQLSELKTEESKLMAQYELAYDLQEIESKMLSSGEMIKIQSWQTYTLELAEPDSVEYYQGSKLVEQIKALAGDFLTSLREYF